MILFSLALVFSAIDPDHVMSPQPGDAIGAEVFLNLTGSRDSQAVDLLGGPGEFGTIPYGDRAFPYVMGTVGPNGLRTMVLFQPEGHGSGDRACRLTPNPDFTTQNLARALASCTSFLGHPLMTVTVPPIGPAPTG